MFSLLLLSNFFFKFKEFIEKEGVTGYKNIGIVIVNNDTNFSIDMNFVQEMESFTANFNNFIPFKENYIELQKDALSDLKKLKGKGIDALIIITIDNYREGNFQFRLFDLRNVDTTNLKILSKLSHKKRLISLSLSSDLGIGYPFCFFWGIGTHKGYEVSICYNEEKYVSFYKHYGYVFTSFFDAYEKFNYFQRGIRIALGNKFIGFGLGTFITDYSNYEGDLSGMGNEDKIGYDIFVFYNLIFFSNKENTKDFFTLRILLDLIIPFQPVIFKVSIEPCLLF
uniref:Uncharacterized protein n=1 Tax=candidate division WOR-3 bacterium TaxID=2052148 RepID=A0A7C4YFJ0_UNCW3